VRVRVLGPIEVDDGDGLMPLAPQAGRLVGLLVACDGRAVSSIRIAEELGLAGGAPVRMAVSRLRKVLGERVAAGPGGYRLCLFDGDWVDVEAFEQLVTTARQVPRASERAGLLQDALALWRGQVYGGLDDVPTIQVAAACAEELRLSTLEDLGETLIELGRREDAILLLEGEGAALRYRERPVALVMRAMAESGRVTEALRAYQRFRVELRDDVGVTPSRALQDLETRLLSEAPGPPAAACAPVSSNLPVRPTRLFGRDVDIASVCALLEWERLVTITAPGGSGKTRLAIAVGEAELPRRPGGVWLVDLTAVTSGAEVVGAVAQALGVTVSAGGSDDEVVRFIARSGLLLILDNCEHVIDACAELVEGLLETGGSSVVLATSREALDVDGERVVVLGTLPSDTLDAPGVQLFVDRATGVDATFALNAATAAAVIGVCSRLDGLPLAIELAAARVRAMTPAELLVALDDRFEVLSGGRRRRRHRTLRATLDWSYDLLATDEQRMFRACGVFVDGFDTDAAAAITTVSPTEATRLMAGLVAKSLVVRTDGGARSRFGMLETIRAYAQDRLVEAGEAGDVRSAHLDYFHHLAYVHGRAVFCEMRHGVKLRPERGNLSAAFEWAAASGRWIAAGELVVGSYGAYVFDGYVAEAVALIERAIAGCAGRDAELVGFLRAITVQTSGWAGDRAAYLDVCRGLTSSDEATLRAVGFVLLAYLVAMSEPDDALACLDQARAALEAAPAVSAAVEADVVGMLTYVPAVLAADRADYVTGLRCAREVIAIEEANDHWTVQTVSATQLAAGCLLVLGDADGALRTLGTLDLFDLTFYEGDDIRALAHIALGELDEARRRVRSHAERSTSGRVSGQACDSALLLAALADAEGDADSAIELLLDMGIGRHAATRMFSVELARRLGVAEEFGERRRRAFSYRRDSEQGPTGASVALAAVRRDLARRGWD
jgi:predicted ATPase/DNA-binding SARP family transcriptional activator